MPRFIIAIIGGSKHDPALLQPCGSYRFMFDPERNQHILDGEAITIERFNEVLPDLCRRWPATSMYKLAPCVEVDPADVPLLERVESQKKLIEELKTRLTERSRKLELSPGS